MNVLEKYASVLTAAGRKRIKEENFALSGGRYPIHDASHARNALARVSQHGTPEEKARVRAAVARKYPGIGKESSVKIASILAMSDELVKLAGTLPKVRYYGSAVAPSISASTKKLVDDLRLMMRSRGKVKMVRGIPKGPTTLGRAGPVTKAVRGLTAPALAARGGKEMRAPSLKGREIPTAGAKKAPSRVSTTRPFSLPGASSDILTGGSRTFGTGKKIDVISRAAASKGKGALKRLRSRKESDLASLWSELLA